MAAKRVIRVENVSKRFTLHHDRPRSFQEVFLKLLRSERAPSREKFWVLRNVSFDVEPGEMLGIVGKNGAGKSTLLKLLTRIIEPTSGWIEVNGRVGALLELGAGFHHELTGRENVYLNGSILGFSRIDMNRIFDDIVSFSGLESFIDVPVKHYSSGMFMRLGFSVAIHLQPDVLLVDEILAVGDQAFQYRCLDRINEMKRQGVTIILVTHTIEHVREMCSRALWLDEGMIQADGPVEHVLDEYMTQVADSDQQALRRAEALRRRQLARTPKGQAPGTSHDGAKRKANWRWGSGEAEIVRVRFLDGQGQERRSFKTGETFTARIWYSAHRRIERPQFGVALHRADGFHICGPNTESGNYPIEAIAGNGFIDFIIPHSPLLPGTFLFSAAIYDHEGEFAYDHHHQAYSFRIIPGTNTRREYGVLRIPSQWRLESGPIGEEDISKGEDML